MTARRRPSNSEEVVAVRRARGPDAPEIARIYVDSWRDAYAGVLPTERLVGMSQPLQARVWAHQIRRSGVGSPILVAETADAGMIGFASGGKARQAWTPPAGEIYTLYVDPSARELGIGRILLSSMLSALAAAGHSRILVWVLADNPARFFYEAMGGRRCGQRLERFWGADREEIAYIWESPPRR